jgi:mannitol-1-phosphate 5-dehydrogenase
MRAVQFGAGNIGRGFIGMLLSKSGYEVCFVARNEKQIALLQRKKQYTVTLANAAGDTSVVKNVTALRISDKEAVMAQVAQAELVTTAVGVGSLKHIAEVIARGIELRLSSINPRPLHVIACENAVRGSSQLKKWVYLHLNPALHKQAEELVSFPDSIVDRIVPVQQNEDPLAVKVEPFYEWVIDRTAIRAGFPGIKGVILAGKLESYMERKLYTVNTGHCSAAYFGYLEGYFTIQEVMGQPRLKAKVRRVMQETGKLLVMKYDLDEAEHQDYIELTLERFSNPGLTDKIDRVGRSPLRKLSYNDRLVGPALQASRMGLEVSTLASAIAAALRFDHRNDTDAAKVQAVIRRTGIQDALGQLTGIPVRHPLHREIVKYYTELGPGVEDSSLLLSESAN